MKHCILILLFVTSLAAGLMAQSGGYTIWNSDGTTTTVTPDGVGGAFIWDTGAGYRGQIINSGNGNYQYWENGVGVSTIIPSGNGGGLNHPVFGIPQ